jgi:hypothetical protein
MKDDKIWVPTPTKVPWQKAIEKYLEDLEGKGERVEDNQKFLRWRVTNIGTHS